MLATAGCIVWAISGPIFNYSDTWQLVINTATTVLTFLMVFVLQHSQNRDAVAIQAKLDELIQAELLSEEEIALLREERRDRTMSRNFAQSPELADAE